MQTWRVRRAEKAIRDVSKIVHTKRAAGRVGDFPARAASLYAIIFLPLVGRKEINEKGHAFLRQGGKKAISIASNIVCIGLHRLMAENVNGDGVDDRRNSVSTSIKY